MNNKHTSDQEQTGLQLLQEDNALGLEATSKDDQHSAGSDRSTQGSGFVVRLARLDRLRDIIGRVVLLHSLLLLRLLLDRLGSYKTTRR